MKVINYILVLCVSLICFSACDTYSDPVVDHTPIYPVAGEWTVTKTNVVTGSKIGVRAYTANTADNSSTKMWLIVGAISGDTHRHNVFVKGKINVSVPAKTFDGSNIDDTFTLGTQFSVTDGKVLLGAATTPSGYPADSIFMTIIASDDSTYTVSGFRRTGWDEDEN